MRALGGRWFWPRWIEPTAGIEVDAPRLLAFTWRWDGEDGETQATLRLDAEGDGTLLTVQHDGFPDEEAASNHVDGWSDCLDRLSATMT